MCVGGGVWVSWWMGQCCAMKFLPPLDVVIKLGSFLFSPPDDQ
ncbi:hypothetical protein PITC_057530 [Penicillium italicum]|uniref:Uncharacterized protein n=1 Tax=Penicillium italicum TaxID=40296 RepID=A0A0A2KY72_PENIT|nr:hypothetical protein PITC_057530 [Penicillium italicum]